MLVIDRLFHILTCVYDFGKCYISETECMESLLTNLHQDLFFLMEYISLIIVTIYAGTYFFGTTSRYRQFVAILSVLYLALPLNSIVQGILMLSRMVGTPLIYNWIFQTSPRVAFYIIILTLIGIIVWIIENVQQSVPDPNFH